MSLDMSLNSYEMLMRNTPRASILAACCHGSKTSSVGKSASTTTTLGCRKRAEDQQRCARRFRNRVQETLSIRQPEFIEVLHHHAQLRRIHVVSIAIVAIEINQRLT